MLIYKMRHIRIELISLSWQENIFPLYECRKGGATELESAKNCFTGSPLDHFGIAPNPPVGIEPTFPYYQYGFLPLKYRGK